MNPETRQGDADLPGQGQFPVLGSAAKAVKLATVDVGTNTTLLLVAEGRRPGDIAVLEDRAEITRLGRGIGTDGRLGAEGIARTLAVLEEYAASARAHGAPICAVGTEALRRAPNASDFLDPAAAILGVPVQVIDGDREAELSFEAAVASFPGDRQQADRGGGHRRRIDRGDRLRRGPGPIAGQPAAGGGAPDRTSHPLRSAHSGRDGGPDGRKWSRRCRRCRRKGSGGNPLALVGTAGTVTTLCAMALGLPELRSQPGARLPARARRSWMRRSSAWPASTQAAREKMAGLDPRRADVILAGAFILPASRAVWRPASVLVNDRGIRWGLLYEPAGVCACPAGGRPGNFALLYRAALETCFGGGAGAGFYDRRRLQGEDSGHQRAFRRHLRARARSGRAGWTPPAGSSGSGTASSTWRGAVNHPLWLRKRLPRDVVVELDVMSKSQAGDIKIELFGDGESFDPDQGDILPDRIRVRLRRLEQRAEHHRQAG